MVQLEKEKADKAYVVIEDKIIETPVRDIFTRYMFSWSKLKCFKEIFLIIFCTCVKIIGDIWLGIWSSDVLKFETSSYIILYVVLNAVISISVLLKFFTVRFGLMRNSDLVYSNMVKNIIRSKFSWFKEIPVVNIIYRLTIDTMKTDIDLCSNVVGILELGVSLLTGFIIFNSLNFGSITVATCVLLYYLRLTFEHYSKTTSNIHHIYRIERSRFTENYLKMMKSSLQLQNFGKSDYFDEEFFSECNRLSVYTAFQNSKCSTWLGVRLTFANSCFLFVVLIRPLIALNSVSSDFSIDQIWLFSLGFAWVNKTLGMIISLGGSLKNLNVDVVTLFNSYNWIDHKEVDFIKGQENVDLEKDSSNLLIEFSNVNIHDNTGIEVLKNLSFSIRENRKVGFIGSYNDGSYEIPLYLLALQERLLSQDENSSIKIYNKDFTKIDMIQLRKKICYLRNNTKLLYGTIKENLDPSGKVEKDKLVKLLHYLKMHKVLDSSSTNTEETSSNVATLDLKKENIDSFLKTYNINSAKDKET